MNQINTVSSVQPEPVSYLDMPLSKFSAVCQAKLEALKNKLVRTLTAQFSDVEAQIVRQAVDEASSLASLTTVPQLLLPTLAEEKVQAMRNWTVRQHALFQNQSMALAA